MFYIYGLRLIGTSEFRYIGCTTEPTLRLLGHRSEKRSPRKREWIAKNLDAIEMVILAEVEDRYDAAVEETRAIRKHRHAGHRLLNVHNSATPIKDISDETRAKMSKPRKRRMSKEQRKSELQKWIKGK